MAQAGGPIASIAAPLSKPVQSLQSGSQFLMQNFLFGNSMPQAGRHIGGAGKLLDFPAERFRARQQCMPVRKLIQHFRLQQHCHAAFALPR